MDQHTNRQMLVFCVCTNHPAPFHAACDIYVHVDSVNQTSVGIVNCPIELCDGGKVKYKHVWWSHINASLCVFKLK